MRGDALRLAGRFAGQGEPATLVLERRAVAGSRGINPLRIRTPDSARP